MRRGDDREMEILVLGGTVYLSKAIATMAVKRGHSVTVAARGASGEPPEGARFVRIDRSSDDGVEPLRGMAFDAVIDVARIAPHVGRVLDVLGGAVGHWTFVSSISVYADHSSTNDDVLEPVAPDESDAAVELYGRQKVACEILVRERMGDKAFIPRPGLVVGPGDENDRFGYWPLRIAEGGEVLAPGRPERPVQWIDVADLATWILDAAERGTSGTCDAIGEPIPMEEFLLEIADALIAHGVTSAHPRFTWLPQDFLTEHGVKPWAGPDSLGLWVPEPDYGGMLRRPAGPAAEAGLRTSPLQATVARWWEASAGAPDLVAGMSREREGAVLGAWRDAERTFTPPAAPADADDQESGAAD
jgi:2'-hydroxyisoflavone reductase